MDWRNIELRQSAIEFNRCSLLDGGRRERLLLRFFCCPKVVFMKVGNFGTLETANIEKEFTSRTPLISGVKRVNIESGMIVLEQVELVQAKNGRSDEPVLSWLPTERIQIVRISSIELVTIGRNEFRLELKLS